MRRESYVFVSSLAWCTVARAQLGVVGQAIVGGEMLTGAGVPSAMLGACEGVLIAPNLLLTAAHCVGYRPRLAQFGTSAESVALELPVERCVAHPDFGLAPGSDIAVCALRGDVPGIEPASWLPRSEPVAPGETLRLVGHGYPTGDGSDVSRAARRVNVSVHAVQNEGRELIVGDETHGACHGDSGGGAFVADGEGWRLVGVVSRRGRTADGGAGETCASTTVVTALEPHRPWLEEQADHALGEAHASCAVAAGAQRAGTSWLALVATLLAGAICRARRRRCSTQSAHACHRSQHSRSS